MSDKAISTANLSHIESNLSKISLHLNNLSGEMSIVKDRVGDVQNAVYGLEADVARLSSTFDHFVNRQMRDNAISHANQNIISLSQKLQKEYGQYDVARRHVIGILEATDLSLVRNDIVSNVTQELVISTPRYWLTPVLLSLSMWFSDKRDVGERALSEALKRDDEKTSLFFALLCRRFKLFLPSRHWLERYLSMQDPLDMEQKAIVMLDALAGGLFGPDENNMCTEKINCWIDELSSRSGFIEKQQNQWQEAIFDKAIDADYLDDEFPNLANHSQTWPVMKEVISWALTHDRIFEDFTAIFNAPPESMSSAEARIYDILLNLAKDYDVEEFSIRRDLRKNQLVIEHDGDMDIANSKFALEMAAYEEHVDFSQMLTTVAMNPHLVNVTNATQKFAFSLSKEWIRSAYDDLTATIRINRPRNVDFEIQEWTGSTVDGSNEQELIIELDEHIEKMKNDAVEAITIAPATYAVLVGCLLLPFVLSTIGLVAAAAGVVFFVVKYFNIKSAKETTAAHYDQIKKDSIELLRALLAEVVDFNELYAQEDAKSENVISFFDAINANDYSKKAMVG